MENPSYYSILTASVRYDDRLSGDQKVLFSEITALSNKNGYCHASNEYFARIYKKDKRTIIRWINKLIEYGYVKKQVIYKPNSSEVEIRKLYPVTTPNPGDKTVTRGDDKTDTRGSVRNVTDNITSVNNTSNNISSSYSSLNEKEETASKQQNFEEEELKNKFNKLLDNYQDVNDCKLNNAEYNRTINLMLKLDPDIATQTVRGIMMNNARNPVNYLLACLKNASVGGGADYDDRE